MFYKFENAKTVGFALMLTTALMGCAPTEVTSNSVISSDQITSSIMEWWNGDYNNDAQIQRLRADGAPIWQDGQYEDGKTFGGHLPVHAKYRPVSLPAFGENVIYLEEKTFKDNHYRQRIYTIIETDDGVRVRLWSFKDKEKYWGTINDLSLLNDITPKDMRDPAETCDLHVKPTNDGRLHMKMLPGSCSFDTTAFDYQVMLSADDFQFRDRIYNPKTNIVTMTAGSFTYHKMDKVSAVNPPE